MSPTLLEFVAAILLLWLAWQIGLVLTPYVLAYFRRLRTPSMPPPPTVADRANAAFRAVASNPPHANDR